MVPDVAHQLFGLSPLIGPVDGADPGNAHDII